MTGESPFQMMRPRNQRMPKPSSGPGRCGRWQFLASAVALVIVLALVWVWLWYYAASIADRTLVAWIERESAAGRIYSCGQQSIGGFPFRIEVQCTDAAAEINSSQPPYAIGAKSVFVHAAVYHPTLLVSDIAAPLAVAAQGQAERYSANWSHARIGVQGLPPFPENAFVTLDHARIDDVAVGNGGSNKTLFTADRAYLQGRIVAGSLSNNPVIEGLLELKAATAPTLHPLTAEPIEGEIDIVLRGLKDLGPKPWAERFREVQAAGGSIEIKRLRLERPDAMVVGTGMLNINAHGKLDGLIRVAVVGIDHIVPLIGVDQMIGRGLDRLTGADHANAQGLGALDRLVPGLGGAVRESANATLIDNLKKMGQPTEVDKKPAILLPLRFSDGWAYLGMLPLGEVPPLF